MLLSASQNLSIKARRFYVPTITSEYCTFAIKCQLEQLHGVIEVKTCFSEKYIEIKAVATIQPDSLRELINNVQPHRGTTRISKELKMKITTNGIVYDTYQSLINIYENLQTAKEEFLQSSAELASYSAINSVGKEAEVSILGKVKRADNKDSGSKRHKI